MIFEEMFYLKQRGYLNENGNDSPIKIETSLEMK
jgi:hypothetical protein